MQAKKIGEKNKSVPLGKENIKSSIQGCNLLFLKALVAKIGIVLDKYLHTIIEEYPVNCKEEALLDRDFLVTRLNTVDSNKKGHSPYTLHFFRPKVVCENILHLNVTFKHLELELK